MTSSRVFRQLFDNTSKTYTYLLADLVTKEAVLIDPVLELADRDAEQIDSLGLKLKYAINTHCHADHITGSGKLKQMYAKDGCKSGISGKSGAKADWHLKNEDKIKFGKYELEVRETPGHTEGCVTFVFHEGRMAFTGDALLIRGCGRTDFQQGNAEILYESNWSQVLSLPDDYQLFPAHDYKGRSVSSVAEEKKFNARLTKTKEEFVNIMKNLGLPYPAQIDRSLPANLVDGIVE